ncbi:hypothetical protein SR187_5885 [Streptococcus ruminantium]|uniref:Uncharacterized protein n=1 Tax=Streptococcus ruminantium TaxID=1917441 RepID=A0A2Z5TWJ8_9STRE|nr:hypothetical protein SR187_5885 [Streptococcus ruminantium]
MNSGGDYYVISISEQDYGAYTLYHDLLGKKVLVAENFIKFIELAHRKK